MLKVNLFFLDAEDLVKEAQIRIGEAQKRQALYYNMRNKELDAKSGGFCFVGKPLVKF